MQKFSRIVLQIFKKLFNVILVTQYLRHREIKDKNGVIFLNISVKNYHDLNDIGLLRKKGHDPAGKQVYNLVGEQGNEMRCMVINKHFQEVETCHAVGQLNFRSKQVVLQFYDMFLEIKILIFLHESFEQSVAFAQSDVLDAQHQKRQAEVQHTLLIGQILLQTKKDNEIG